MFWIFENMIARSFVRALNADFTDVKVTQI